MIFFRTLSQGVYTVFAFFQRRVQACIRFIRLIKTFRKRYLLAGKIKNIVLKLLNLAASAYVLYTKVEPFLNREGKEKASV